MIHKNWGVLVKNHFSFTQTDMPNIGDTVNGFVVANAPFGIWIDIGVGIPGLLEIIQLNRHTYPPENYPEFMPKIGEEILAKVVAIQKHQIDL